MNYLLSIDPGSRKSGVVLMTVERKPKLIHHEVWTPKHKSCPVSFVDEIYCRHWLYADDFLAVIEDQYLGKNPDTMKKIVINRGKWEAACEFQGIDVEITHPRTWQAAMLGLPGNAKSAQVKKMYMMIARKDTGIELTEDECAAWCMGKYQVQMLLSGMNKQKGDVE